MELNNKVENWITFRKEYFERQELNEGFFDNLMKGINNFSNLVNKKSEDLAKELSKSFGGDSDKFKPLAVKRGQAVLLKTENSYLLLEKIGDLRETKTSIFQMVTTTDETLRGKLEANLKKEEVMVFVESKTFAKDSDINMTLVLKMADIKLEGLQGVADQQSLQKK